MPRIDLRDTEQVRQYLWGFDPYGDAAQEGINYVNEALERFLITLAMIPQATSPGQPVLELGASPYYLTLLLLNQTQYRPELANFFGDAFPSEGPQVVANAHTGESHEFCYHNFNAERDRFPYADASFALVLCGEIIEHLTVDPTHMLCEIHRVLAPGGYLLLTTPNVLNLGYVLSLLKGRNIFHPYSGYGVYGRHQREYTLHEVQGLLEACGYEVVQTQIRDLHPSPRGQELLKRARPTWRDHLFVLARTVGERRQSYPDWLYIATHAIHHVADAEVVMGRNDVGHIGPGWWGLDAATPPHRWTMKEAHVSLRATAPADAVEIELSAGPAQLGPVTLWLGVNGMAEKMLLAAPTDRWEILRAPLPAALAGEVALTLSVAHTRNPAALGVNLDGRDLGVMVRRIGLVEPKESA